MTFDISKTETFVPFLWILAKTATVITLFSLLSADVLHWKIDNAALSTPDATPMQRISTSAFTDVWDRFIAVLLLLLVLCERGMDMHIANRSEVAQNVTKKTLTGLNTHVLNDIFVFFCIVHSVQTQNIGNSACAVGRYGHLLASGLWFICGFSFFLMETKLKRALLHYDQDKGRRYGSHTWQAASPILCYIGVVLLMALSLTSPCLHQVYFEMTYTEYCLRLILYSLNVCGRCYTQGVPGDSFVHEIPNVVLFGWLVLLPTACVYLSMAVCTAAYLRFVTSLTNSRKNTSMILPIHVTDAPDMIVPIQPLPYAASFTAPYTDDSRPNNAESTAEFLAKLQNMEESMMHTRLPAPSPSISKSSLASKRKTATLF